MPAAGEPVASMTMSISGAAIMARASSVRCVVPFDAALANELATCRDASHPVRASDTAARAGCRSAMPLLWRRPER